MRSSEGSQRRAQRLSTVWRVILVAVAWLVVISSLHFLLNTTKESETRPVVRLGYMPVVANLAAPLLDHTSMSAGEIRFEAVKFFSFAEMGEALRANHIQGAFIIAPLGIVLHQQGADVRVVYIGNRHESTLVYRKDLSIRSFSDLAGRTVAVPMRYSGHNLSLLQLVERAGMRESDLHIVELNPPDMASALASGSLDAYYVGEPFAAQTVQSGHSEVLHFVSEVWPGFICNLLLVNQDLIEEQRDVVDALVSGAARVGLWAESHPDETADVVSRYWNQDRDLVAYALQQPPGRIVYDRFVPKQNELQFLADEMLRFGLLESNDIEGLVDDRFAQRARGEQAAHPSARPVPTS